MLDITLLGTGGTQPLPERALAAACITVGGSNLLLDCGEGTQTAPFTPWPDRCRSNYG